MGRKNKKDKKRTKEDREEDPVEEEPKGTAKKGFGSKGANEPPNSQGYIPNGQSMNGMEHSPGSISFASGGTKSTIEIGTNQKESGGLR